MAHRSEKYLFSTKDKNDTSSMRIAAAMRARGNYAPPPYVDPKPHRGVYHSPPPVPPELHEFVVGPFTVRISRRNPHYHLYTCEVLGKEIYRQISWPSFHQLKDAMSQAVWEGVLERKEAEKLWETVVNYSVKHPT